MNTKFVRLILCISLIACGLLCYQQQYAGAEGQDENAKGKNEKKEALVITGQCHCGKIKYKATGEVVECNYCSCRGCQLATGTLKAPFVKIFRKDLQILSGEPKTFQSDSKAQCDVNGVWHFCPDCGSQIFWVGHNSDKMDLFAGTLDDTSLFKVKEEN